MDWGEFIAALAPMGVTPGDRQREQLQLYSEMLREYNERFNLTAIVLESEVWRKHFLDSLSALLVLPHRARGIDIGSGAGFPGIPLAIICEEMHFLLLDSLKKRVGFLQEVITKIGLATRVSALHGRAEDVARQSLYREKFDFAISRGVAKLVVLCELSLPFVREGGFFVAMKGPRAPLEIEEAKHAVSLLGGGKMSMVAWCLPGGEEERLLVVVPKIGSTPLSFPRQAGLPEKKPLL
ncbi:MAG: Ribosomal RNA small subunit methyltransferase G [Firmicutes bacterium]|nr:Ribosomal RNA small subunit methyltransferase G [Bacillota bacterium]